MSDKKPISYSAYSKYVTCGHMYKLHYIDGIRPEVTPFHLVFGSAVDKALNALLEVHPTDPLEHASLELGRLFVELVDFSEKDYSPQLIARAPTACIVQELRQLGWKGDDLDELANALFNKRYKEELSEGQDQALKWLVYYSAREHIKSIIAGFEQYILPQIETIVSVQRKVKRGILDFEATFKGVEGVVIVDNKTSARPYKDDAVIWSVQHASYGAITGAYVTFDKNQKGPVSRPQLILQKVPEHNVKMVEETYQAVEKAIDAGHFPRNLNACGKQYGKPCPYINLCWGNSMKGLCKKNEEK